MGSRAALAAVHTKHPTTTPTALHLFSLTFRIVRGAKLCLWLCSMFCCTCTFLSPEIQGLGIILESRSQGLDRPGLLDSLQIKGLALDLRKVLFYRHILKPKIPTLRPKL
jgi:hypothetical protein